MKHLFFIIVFFVLQISCLVAQCPMCRASAEKSDYAAGLNTGIFYLLLLPAGLCAALIAFWYFNREKFKINQ